MTETQALDTNLYTPPTTPKFGSPKLSTHVAHTFVWPHGGGSASLAGTFGPPDWQQMPMKRRENAEGFELTLPLIPGQKYSYKFVIDGHHWQTDWTQTVVHDQHGHANHEVTVEQIVDESSKDEFADRDVIEERLHWEGPTEKTDVDTDTEDEEEEEKEVEVVPEVEEVEVVPEVEEVEVIPEVEEVEVVPEVVKVEEVEVEEDETPDFANEFSPTEPSDEISTFKSDTNEEVEEPHVPAIVDDIFVATSAEELTPPEDLTPLMPSDNVSTLKSDFNEEVEEPHVPAIVDDIAVATSAEELTPLMPSDNVSTLKSDFSEEVEEPHVHAIVDDIVVATSAEELPTPTDSDNEEVEEPHHLDVINEEDSAPEPTLLPLDEGVDFSVQDKLEIPFVPFVETAEKEHNLFDEGATFEEPVVEKEIVEESTDKKDFVADEPVFGGDIDFSESTWPPVEFVKDDFIVGEEPVIGQATETGNKCFCYRCYDDDDCCNDCLDNRCMCDGCFDTKCACDKCIHDKCLCDDCLDSRCLCNGCFDTKCACDKCIEDKCLCDNCLDNRCLCDECYDTKCGCDKCIDDKCLCDNCLDDKCFCDGCFEEKSTVIKEAYPVANVTAVSTLMSVVEMTFVTMLAAVALILAQLGIKI